MFVQQQQNDLMEVFFRVYFLAVIMDLPITLCSSAFPVHHLKLCYQMHTY